MMTVGSATPNIKNVCLPSIKCMIHKGKSISSRSHFMSVMLRTCCPMIGSQGMVTDFKIPRAKDPKLEKHHFQWLYTNGFLGIVFTVGLLYNTLKSKRTRSWWYGTGCLRSFIADYGVPSMVVVWTPLSFGVPSKVPSGIPRRLFSPVPWDCSSSRYWTVIKDMVNVPPVCIFVAFIPAIMIAGLYFFDHSMAAQMAEQKEFNLKKSSAYHYDILLLGFITLLCGLIGLPPSKGVLPQSPVHTKSLAVLKRLLIRRKMVRSAKESIKRNASNSEIYGKMQHVFLEIESSPVSLLVAVSVFAVPTIKQIPTSVFWGYFAYMAIDSLPGNQFWERMLLIFITPGRWYKVLEGAHASFVESVPFRCIATFTIFQFLYFLLCSGVTRIAVAGILFPLPFFVLIIRQHVLPKLFCPRHLHEPQLSISLSSKEKEAPGQGNEDSKVELCDAEILDWLTTSRGEWKVRTASFQEDKNFQVYPEHLSD